MGLRVLGLFEFYIGKVERNTDGFHFCFCHFLAFK